MYGDVDEDGEPTFDPDSPSREGTPELPEDEEEWQDSPSASPAARAATHDRSPKAKPRKRLVKKSTVEESPERDEADAEEEDERSYKRKSRDVEDGEFRKRVRKLKEGKEGKDRDGRGADGSKKSKFGSTASKLAKLARIGSGGSKNDRPAASDRPSRSKDKREEKSPWEDPNAAEDSEEDRDVERTAEDDNFIDDAGAEKYSDDEAAGSPSHAPEAEEAEEDEDDLSKFFKSGKKKRKATERPAQDIAMYVEQFMAKLDVAAEADADLNRASKPAIEKLKILPELLNVLEKRQLQQEFLDRGVLSSLKNWLEPLPDGSLPNMNIRSALLKLLTDLPIDVEVFERREQLKKSGLGKVVMFLSRLAEETPGNRKLARDMVDKWSRPIFQKSTRYEDLRQYDDEKPPPRRTPVKKPAPKRMMESGGDELVNDVDPEELKPGDPGYRTHASRPQALPLDFVIRPPSKVDAESVRAQAKRQRMDERRSKMNKKLQQLRAPKKKNLQASRLSVEGRGLVKFY